MGCPRRLAADGSHIMSWGESGTDDGMFNLPHNLALHPDGDKLLVCDRENNRCQVRRRTASY